MQVVVAADLKRSAQLFISHVLPRCRSAGWFRDCQFVSNEFATIPDCFDVMAGIDAWLFYDGAQIIRALASRVQWDCHCYATFNIRYTRSSGATTEYEKRLRAIKCRDRLYPHHTVHAYLGSRDRDYPFQGAGLILTESLYLYAERWLNQDDRRVFVKRNPTDGNTFMCVPWKALIADGVKMQQVGTIDLKQKLLFV